MLSPEQDITTSKYFTPDIEDLRIGYQCEIREMITCGLYAQLKGEEEYSTIYKPVIIGKEVPIPEGEFSVEKLTKVFESFYNQHPSVDKAISLLKKDKLKVPYLTKEQIEAEGWTALEDISPFTGKVYKYRKAEKPRGFNEHHIYTLEWDGISTPNIKIHLESESSWHHTNQYIYVGSCRDINTLRYICKLLGI